MKRKILLIFLILLFLFIYFLIVPRRWIVKKEIKPEFGFSFSHRHATILGLDWQETYLKLLDELKPKSVRIPVFWMEVEGERGKFDFGLVDWQIKEAEKREIPVVLVIGYRSFHRPECYPPDWARDLSQKEFKEAVFSFLEEGVKHFSQYGNIEAWQVENEPLDVLRFWCRKLSPSFVAKEIEVVKANDSQNRPILLTFGGEIFLRSYWRGLVPRIDIIGVSFYPRVWHYLARRYVSAYDQGFFSLRNIAIERGEAIRLGKRFWIVEFEAEPYGPKPITELSQEEIEETATPAHLQEYYEVIEKIGGVERIYFWGVEWWYKELLEGRLEMWEKGKEFFSS